VAGRTGFLAKDEADLTKAFMAFVGRAGSPAGISGQVNAQLRRHFATALMSFAIAKLGRSPLLALTSRIPPPPVAGRE